MVEFESMLVKAWHDCGVIVLPPARPKRKSLVRHVQQQMQLGLSSLVIGVAVAMASLPASSAAFVAGNSWFGAKGAAVGDEVSNGYWGNVISLLKKLPEAKEDRDPFTPEPYL